MAIAQIFPSVPLCSHTSVPVSYFSLSFATTADIIGQRNAFLCGTEWLSQLAFTTLRGKVHFIMHLTCSPLLLSREQGMGLCSCLVSSCMSPLLAMKGKSELQEVEWGYVPHEKNCSICPQLEVKAGQVTSKDGIDCSYFLWGLENVECLPKKYSFYELLLWLANLCQSKSPLLGSVLLLWSYVAVKLC